jgi:transposase
MTTATTAPTTTGLILALDLGQYKSGAGAYHRVTAAARFDSFITARHELRKRFEQHRPAGVLIEACALAGWVHDLGLERGLVCKVAHTASEAWKFQHTKRQTDKDDARRLAQLEALGQLPTAVLPPKQTREWPALIAYRQNLVGRRCAGQNRSRALLVGQGLPAPRGHRAGTELGLEGIGRHAKALAECASEDLGRGLLPVALTAYRQTRELLDPAAARLDTLARADEGVQLLETIPGAGRRPAAAVVAHRGDAKRFANGQQVAAYAGLVPKQFPSGATDRRGRITRRGPAILRKLLVECAWVMLRYNA